MSQAPGETSSANQGLFLVQLGRARKHLREGRLDQARQELEAAQSVRPNDEDVLNLISVIEFKLGRYEDAARAARQLVSENPASAVLHANLGLILFKAGALAEAEQELRKAIELRPDHARSHLYLGLLYRTRGKLGLALEHLRFAGAKRLVTEIEEILRRSMREDPAKTSAIDRSTAAPESVADMIVPEEKPASGPEASAPGEEDETPFGESSAPNLRLVPPAPPAHLTIGKVPIVTMVGEGRERMRRDEDGDPRVTAAAAPAGARPLFHVRPDGGLEVASREAVFVRKGSVVWYSGKVQFSREPAFQGTRFERILRAEGRGNFFLSDIGKSAYGRDLAGRSLHVEASRLLALDTALTFRLDPIHDFRNDWRVDILKVHGHGTVILSIGGSLLGHDVSLDFPLIVAARDLVAWSGNVVPSVVEDRFL
ncbi:MAG TPA: tetratricopeptide repeat protein, partial [Thermoanaerobaculia bacterium]|nr:tetratricopeptide repeat protein [Thermoanaerobaculia bacterium]